MIKSLPISLNDLEKLREQITADIKKLFITANVPIGTLIWWTGTLENKPEGYLVADGTTFDSTTYPELYAAYGNNNILPNYIGRFVKGSTTAGVSEEAGLPNIEGTVGNLIQGVNKTMTATGAFGFSNEQKEGGVTSNTYTKTYNINFDASRSDFIYGNSTTVTPENTSAIPLIRAK